MYLTAVDLCWEENVPIRIPTRKKAGGQTPAWSFRPSYGSQCPLPCLGTCKARAWGQIWPAFGNTDKPSPGSEPLPQVKRTERQTTGTGTRTLALTRSLESLRTLLCFGGPFHVLHGQLTPGALPGRLRSLGGFHRLSPASEMPRRPLTGALVESREALVEEEQPDDARRLREGPLALAVSLLPSPGAAQGAWSPQTTETTSSVPQEAWLCVCEWWTLLCPPIQPFRGQRDRAGSMCPPWRQRKEKVFYIRYLFNISF